jgi:hypothetical protein
VLLVQGVWGNCFYSKCPSRAQFPAHEGNRDCLNRQITGNDVYDNAWINYS